jgi:hypothetical protein
VFKGRKNIVHDHAQRTRKNRFGVPALQILPKLMKQNAKKRIILSALMSGISLARLITVAPERVINTRKGEITVLYLRFCPANRTRGIITLGNHCRLSGFLKNKKL